MEGLTLEDLHILRHMVGMGEKPRDWGYRNYYATSGGPAKEALDRLSTLAYVTKGRADETMAYYHATESGCIAAGLTGKQIKRALED